MKGAGLLTADFGKQMFFFPTQVKAWHRSESSHIWRHSSSEVFGMPQRVRSLPGRSFAVISRKGRSNMLVSTRAQSTMPEVMPIPIEKLSTPDFGQHQREACT